MIRKIFIIILLLSNNVFSQILENAIIVIGGSPNDDLIPPVSKFNNYFFYYYFKYEDIMIYRRDTILKDTLEGEEIKILYHFENNVLRSIKGYYSDGRIYGEATFDEEGRRDGKTYGLYKNGQLMAFAYYEKGKQISPLIYYYEDGKFYILSDKEKTDSSKMDIIFYPNGMVNVLYIYIDTVRDCYGFKNTAFTSYYYYPNGHLDQIDTANYGTTYFEAYFNGRLTWRGKTWNALWWQVGKWEEWDKNGIKRREYYFNDTIPNIKEGVWKWWDEKGRLIKIEEYKSDSLIKRKEFRKVEIKKK